MTITIAVPRVGIFAYGVQTKAAKPLSAQG
ncbi:hypothetical protein JOD45_001219 [Scopulibacillus daqui]|uniref:Uncharacterized protein n=1 Tax=Scopulibacillus daqui TaxID=1469162 RepID=A0ABS2PZ67_9BACL|nr:hypothetical protein [Scopulibacillus daqui]